MENVAGYLSRRAAESPDALALYDARTNTRITFGALDTLSAHLAGGLRAAGLRPGDKTLVMLKPGVRFLATAFALLRVGAVPVFADPGLGRAHLLPCIEAVAPRAMVAVRVLHAVAAVRPGAFRSVALRVSEGWWPGAHSLDTLTQAPPHTEVATVALDDAAIIAFTTGSTGAPKGVVFTHRVLHAQVRAFVELVGITADDVQLALLPLFAILGPGLGCATVLPDMDARHPAKIDAAKLARTLLAERVTFGFGSPTPLGLLADHCALERTKLPSLRAVVVGGAPVSGALVAKLQTMLADEAEVIPAYGATEALPIARAEADDVIATATGDLTRGTLLGRPVPSVELRLVPVTRERLTSAEPVRNGTVGEIVIRAPIVTPAYAGETQANRLAKIDDPRGAWHRMGDLGRWDDAGRLWFCGRKADRIEVDGVALDTACVEPVFARHPSVARVALVRAHGRPVLVVEPYAGEYPSDADAREKLVRELLALGAEYATTRLVKTVLVKRALPLDIRHNAKILREVLGRWAEEQGG